MVEDTLPVTAPIVARRSPAPESLTTHAAVIRDMAPAN